MLHVWRARGTAHQPQLRLMCRDGRASWPCPAVADGRPIPLLFRQGVYVLMSGLDYERLVLSAGPLGIMQACPLLPPLRVCPALQTRMLRRGPVPCSAVARLWCCPCALLRPPSIGCLACPPSTATPFNFSCPACPPSAAPPAHPDRRPAWTRCCPTAGSAPSLGSASASSRWVGGHFGRLGWAAPDPAG